MFNNSIDTRLESVLLRRDDEYHLEGRTRRKLKLVPYSNDHKINKNNDMITIESNKISFWGKLKIMFLTPWFDLDPNEAGSDQMTKADCEKAIWKRVDTNLKQVMNQTNKNSTD